jgi:hypothetical protein
MLEHTDPRLLPTKAISPDPKKEEYGYDQRGGATRGQFTHFTPDFVTLWGKPERNAGLETDLA